MKPRFVLVTGATSGIGLAAAVLLALEGYEVIASGRSEEKLQIVAKAAEKAGVTIRRILGDVSVPESVETMRQQVLTLTNGHGVDVLVNNAGYAEGGALEEIPLNRLRKQFDTNVIGLVAVTQAFLPEMRSRRFGKIINVSSVVGKVSIPLLGAYTASKFAVEALSDAMRMELAPAGIEVVKVAPGSINTNFGQTVVGTIKTWMKEDSPYAKAYQKFSTDRSRDGGASPTVIARAILQAVRDQPAKARYAVPLDSKAMPVVKALLPTKTLDAIISRAVLGKK